MFLREKIDDFKIFSGLKNLTLDIKELNNLAKDVSEMLEDDTILEEKRSEYQAEQKKNKIEKNETEEKNKKPAKIEKNDEEKTIAEQREKIPKFVEVECGTPAKETRSIGFKFIKNASNEKDDELNIGSMALIDNGDDFDKSPMKIPKALRKKGKRAFGAFKLKMGAPPMGGK